MKRAARHFGERLGNALYVKGNGIRTAPRTNRDALVELGRRDSLNLFGDQAALRSVEEKKVAVATTIATTAEVHGNAEAIRTAAAATLTTGSTGAAVAAAAARRQQSNAHQNHSNGSNNNTNRTLVHSGRPLPPPAPSPIVSRGPLQQQQGVVNATNFGGNQNYLRQQQQRPTSQMAPPPRPMYNPANNATGTTAYQLLNNQLTSVDASTGVDTMKRGLTSGGDDSTMKRQKVNPYNNNRLSV